MGYMAYAADRGSCATEPVTEQRAQCPYPSISTFVGHLYRFGTTVQFDRAWSFCWRPPHCPAEMRNGVAAVAAKKKGTNFCCEEVSS